MRGGFTGRDVVVKFAGNYHGHVDSLLVAAGSSAATLGTPSSPGVTPGTARDTVVCEYNDAAGLDEVFVARGDEIAAVIFEPVVGNMGVVAPTEEFLRALRELTSRCGALLICDEVMTGFRLAIGGAQERFWHRSGPDDDGEDRRRRPAGGGLRRAARGDGATCCPRARCFRRAR